MRRILPIAALAAALAAPGLVHASPAGTGVVVDQPDGFADPLTGAGNRSGVTGRESVSADGRYVAFRSSADGFAGTDDDTLTNVYRKDRRTGQVVLVSVATNGAAANGDSDDARISADGSRVAFTSRRRTSAGPPTARATCTCAISTAAPRIWSAAPTARRASPSPPSPRR